MSETFEPQTLAIGGLQWRVPRLPWRLSRLVQPALLSVIRAAGGAGVSEARLLGLGVEEFDRLAEAIYLTITAAVSGPKLDRVAFDELPIGVGDLIAAFSAAAACCGMQPRKAEGEPGPKAATESIGTS